MEQGVLDVVKLKYWSFIPRKGSGRRNDRAIAPEAAPRAIEKGRRGEALAEDEIRPCSPRPDPRWSRRCARRPTGFELSLPESG